MLPSTGVDKGEPRAPSSSPLNGRAKKKGRGYLYQMPNMYTCIAYLKTWFIKVLILRPKML